MSSTAPTQFASPTNAVSSGRIWAGRIIAGLVTLFLLFDAAMKFVRPAAVLAAFARTGWPPELSVPLGVILLTCTILYVIPRTAVLGGLMLTGYLGGAVAANVRLENPLFSHALFPVYFGVLIWASLLLRDSRLVEFLPIVQRRG
jgi:ABC-type transport system involved in cytochrome c biogenesis permease component